MFRQRTCISKSAWTRRLIRDGSSDCPRFRCIVFTSCSRTHAQSPFHASVSFYLSSFIFARIHLFLLLLVYCFFPFSLTGRSWKKKVVHSLAIYCINTTTYICLTIFPLYIHDVDDNLLPGLTFHSRRSCLLSSLPHNQNTVYMYIVFVSFPFVTTNRQECSCNCTRTSRISHWIRLQNRPSEEGSRPFSTLDYGKYGVRGFL